MAKTRTRTISARARQSGVSTADRPDARAVGARVAVLFEAHGTMIYGLCRLLMRDPSEAEDAAQETFLSAHQALLAEHEPREPAAWLAAIARNECRSRIRKRMRWPLALIDSDGVVPQDLAEITDRQTEVEALCRELADLPQQQRDALLLREFYGLTYEESAAALGISLAALESLIHRGRERLIERIRPARAAHTAVAVPFALWDSLAAALPGFGPAAKAGGLAGALAKLGSAPVAAKLAATTAAMTVGVGAVGVSTVHQKEPRAEHIPATAFLFAATPKTSIERSVVRARGARVESLTGIVDGQPSRPGAGSSEKADDPEDRADEGEDLAAEHDDDDEREDDVDRDEDNAAEDGGAEAADDDDRSALSDEVESDADDDERDESDGDVSEHE